MLIVGLTKEAVEHKMTQDGIQSKIIDVVIQSDSTKTKKSTVEDMQSKIVLSKEEQELASKYRRMLRMSIPPAAVRHKMEQDQASYKVITTVFPEEAKALERKQLNKDTARSRLTEEEQEIASKYQKMLNMGVPAEGVRHNMMKESIDQKIVRFVFKEDLESANIESILSDEEIKMVEKFKKMLKMHIPEQAVRHKMKQENTSEKIVASVFGKSSKTDPKIVKTSQNSSKLVALHWTPLSDAEIVDKSVWRAHKKRKVTSDAQPGTKDISKLVELFRKKSSVVRSSAMKLSAASSDSTEKAKLIDLTRANNVAISLKTFKDFSHEKLAQTIANLDPQELITGERVNFIKDLLPNREEEQTIKAYKGEESRLVPAEKFFRFVVKVKRIKEKVDVMRTMVTFRVNAKELSESYCLLQRACTQVLESEKLQTVLDMVLHIGNIMNEGTRTGGAVGFKFDSLLKLTQTKSSDGKTTVLDYLVMIFVAKDMREILQLNTDFPDCQEGSRMLLGELNTETTSMVEGLKGCKSELKILMKEISKGSNSERKQKLPLPPTGNPMTGVLAAINSLKSEDNSEDLVPAKKELIGNYLSAIKTNADKKDMTERKPGKLQLDQFERNCDISSGTKIHTTSLEIKIGESAEQVPEKKNPSTIHGGIRRLEEFVIEAEDALKELKKNKGAAVDACRALANYCGEQEGENAAITLLDVLFQFASKLDSAVSKYDQKLEMERKRSLRKEQKKRRKNMRESFGSDRSIISLVRSDEDSVRTDAASVRTDATSIRTDATSIRTDATSVRTDATSVTRSFPEFEQGPQTSNVSKVVMVNHFLRDASLKARKDFEDGIVYDDVKDKNLRAYYQTEHREQSNLRYETGYESPSASTATLNTTDDIDTFSAIRKQGRRHIY